MIYKNVHKFSKGKSNEQKDLVFDVFQDYVDYSEGESKQKIKNSSISYNFNLSSGELKTGYGFKKLSMPTSSVDIDNEQEIELDGNKVYALWSFKWYDYNKKENKYYVMYYNDLNHIGFANLFNNRPLPLFPTTTFTQTPIGCNTRYENDDAMVFSSNTDGLLLITGYMTQSFAEAPALISICSAFDKLFAITAGDRASLVYSSDKDITKWTKDNLQEVVFDDDRGKLNKVLAFNDYVYVFRDFGISRVSIYSTKNNFDISQLYQSDSYIYPGTIASSGDRIYFLEGSGIFSFNGSSTSKINLDSDQLLKDSDKRFASAVCFEGKYYLACRYDFNDGQSIGCENQEDYVNNILFVLDLVSKKVNVLRGIDIKQLCVLNNPYKSKVVACFNGNNNDKLGELTLDGKIFTETTEKVWSSVLSDLSFPEKVKRTKFLTIKTLTDCEIKVESEKQSKIYEVFGSSSLQKIKIDVKGKELKISFKTSQVNASISNVKLIYDVI